MLLFLVWNNVEWHSRVRDHNPTTLQINLQEVSNYKIDLIDRLISFLVLGALSFCFGIAHPSVSFCFGRLDILLLSLSPHLSSILWCDGNLLPPSLRPSSSCHDCHVFVATHRCIATVLQGIIHVLLTALWLSSHMPWPHHTWCFCLTCAPSTKRCRELAGTHRTIVIFSPHKSRTFSPETRTVCSCDCRAD